MNTSGLSLPSTPSLTRADWNGDSPILSGNTTLYDSMSCPSPSPAPSGMGMLSTPMNPFQSFQQEISRLTLENAALKGFYDSLQKSYQDMTVAIKSTAGNVDRILEAVLALQTTGISSVGGGTSMMVLSIHKDYKPKTEEQGKELMRKGLKFFSYKQFENLPERKANTNGNLIAGQRDSKKIKPYIETESGVPLDTLSLNQIDTTLAGILMEVAVKTGLPPTWRRWATAEMKNHVYSHLVVAHPEMGLADGFWKAESMVTRYFPQWIRNRKKLIAPVFINAGIKVEEEDDDTDPDEDEGSDKVETSGKRKGESDSLLENGQGTSDPVPTKRQRTLGDIDGNGKEALPPSSTIPATTEPAIRLQIPKSSLFTRRDPPATEDVDEVSDPSLPQLSPPEVETSLGSANAPPNVTIPEKAQDALAPVEPQAPVQQNTTTTSNNAVEHGSSEQQAVTIRWYKPTQGRTAKGMCAHDWGKRVDGHKQDFEIYWKELPENNPNEFQHWQSEAESKQKNNATGKKSRRK
ncbi:hypothetical protein V5O48_016738 [Marasmius crinis-equi]|uniref:Uncharacterized protein n=1 Tax=Marasmius crinis-equi TaxID=585013 RepID=A0ABR3EQV6_9AGAR